jgi:hypothetical protein
MTNLKKWTAEEKGGQTTFYEKSCLLFMLRNLVTLFVVVWKAEVSLRAKRGNLI